MHVQQVGAEACSVESWPQQVVHARDQQGHIGSHAECPVELGGADLVAGLSAYSQVGVEQTRLAGGEPLRVAVGPTEVRAVRTFVHQPLDGAVTQGDQAGGHADILLHGSPRSRGGHRTDRTPDGCHLPQAAEASRQAATASMTEARVVVSRTRVSRRPALANSSAYSSTVRSRPPVMTSMFR